MHQTIMHTLLALFTGHLTELPEELRICPGCGKQVNSKQEHDEECDRSDAHAAYACHYRLF